MYPAQTEGCSFRVMRSQSINRFLSLKEQIQEESNMRVLSSLNDSLPVMDDSRFHELSDRFAVHHSLPPRIFNVYFSIGDGHHCTAEIEKAIATPEQLRGFDSFINELQSLCYRM